MFPTDHFLGALIHIVKIKWKKREICYKWSMFKCLKRTTRIPFDLFHNPSVFGNLSLRIRLNLYLVFFRPLTISLSREITFMTSFKEVKFNHLSKRERERSLPWSFIKCQKCQICFSREIPHKHTHSLNTHTFFTFTISLFRSLFVFFFHQFSLSISNLQ